MIEEFTPEIIWIAGLGAVVVFGLMIAVWYVSTRESGEKKEPTGTNATSSSVSSNKWSKKKKQYGSPRKKKEMGIVSENESLDMVPENETMARTMVSEEKAFDDVKQTEVPLQHAQMEGEKPRSSKGSNKMRNQDAKANDHSLRDHPTNTRPSNNGPSNDRPLGDRASNGRSSNDGSSSNHPSVDHPSHGRPSNDRSLGDHPSTVAKKTKTKVKQQQIHFGKDDFSEIPGSFIVQAVANSTLSEEEIQQVMEKLLEKQDEEWEATGRSDNVKTLKKANEELIARCHDAEKSAQLHSQRVKEIGFELKQERSRLMNSEKAFQIKMGKQQEDLENMKKKVQQYKEEVEMLKDVTSSATPSGEMKRLEENNQAIRNQLSQLVSEKSQNTNQMKKLVDTNTQLTQQLAQETEKVETIQKDKKLIQGELLNSRGDIKRMEHEISELQEREKVLQSQLAQTEEALINEKKMSLSIHKENSQENDKLQLLNTVKQEHMVALKELQDKHILEINEIRSQAQTEFEEMKVALEADGKIKGAELEKLHKENNSLKKQVQDLGSEIQNLTLATKVNGQEEVIQENSVSAPSSISEEEFSELKMQNSALQEKIDDLKTKNNTLRDKSWKARDEQEVTVKECNDKLKASEKEHSKQLGQLRESIDKEHLQQLMFLKSLFPTLPDVKDKDFNDWVSLAEEYISENLKEINEGNKNKKMKIDEMTKEVEEGVRLTNELRDTLSDTLAKLEDVMEKCEEKENVYKETIHREELHRIDIEKELADIKQQLETLKSEYHSCRQECEELKNEQEKNAQENEKKLSTSQKQITSLLEEITLKEKEKEQVEERLKQLEEHISGLTAENDNLTKNVTKVNDDLNEYKKKLEESEKLAESLKNANQDLNHRLQCKFSPPPTSTSSDV